IATRSQEVFDQAREANGFSLWAPYLSQMINGARQESAYLGVDPNDGQATYTKILSANEPGWTGERLLSVLREVRDWIIPFMQRLPEPRPLPRMLDRSFSVLKQAKLGRSVLKDMGYSFSAGDLTIATSPFCCSVGPSDCRVTIEQKPVSIMGIYSALHEGGHGL